MESKESKLEISKKRNMIELVKVADRVIGNQKANEILTGLVDSQTLLVISGGTAPDYDKILVTPGNLLPGAVCLGDERYGRPFHADSNELILKNSGLLDYLHLRNIPFYKILSGQATQIVAENYNIKVEELFRKFSKKVGIMGVGANLHTSGIFPNTSALKSESYIVAETIIGNKFPNRITLTAKALGEFTNFVILMFGEEKRAAIAKMMNENENNEQMYPAIFYRKSPIKSFLITDVQI